MTRRRSHPKPEDSAADTNPPTLPAPTPATAPAEQGLTVHPLIVRLVEWRKKKGWTQEQAAEHLDIPLNTLRGYECGNRNPGGANTEKILTLIGLPKRRQR